MQPPCRCLRSQSRDGTGDATNSTPPQPPLSVNSILRLRRCLAMGVRVTRYLPDSIVDPVFFPTLFTRDYVCYSLRTFNFWSSPVSPRRAPTAEHTPNPTPWPRRRPLPRVSLSSPLPWPPRPRALSLNFLPFVRRAARDNGSNRYSEAGKAGRPLLTHPTTPRYTTTALAPEQNAEWSRWIAFLLLFPRLRTIGEPIPCAVGCRVSPVAPTTWYSLGRRPPLQPFSSCFPLVRGRRPGRLSEW